MKIALRTDAPTGAGLWQRIACAVIRGRLVSRFCHGGIVINGNLLHATAAGGLHMLKAGEWSSEKWELYDIGGDDEWVMRQFEQIKGAKYDWFSLLAFVGLHVRDSSRFYCFEWCWLAVKKEGPTARVTPELLLREALQNLGIP